MLEFFNLPILINHYLILSSLIFLLGVIGIFLNRKNVISILMSIELILLGVNINFIAFSYFFFISVSLIFSTCSKGNLDSFTLTSILFFESGSDSMIVFFFFCRVRVLVFQRLLFTRVIPSHRGPFLIVCDLRSSRYSCRNLDILARQSMYG